MFSTYLRKNFNVLPKGKQKDIESIREQKRYVPFHDRPNTSHIHMDSFLMSQGVKDCNSWKGIALGKSVYDFALIPMIIWENKPATILEIGSGEGASAVWMADLCKSYNLPTRVYSIDIEPPNITHDRVIFAKGDSRGINNTMFDVEVLPHPWLIVEDAHVTVNEVMKYFAKHMHRGDYIIIEDSRSKMQRTLEVPSALLVDTYYCDYFGRNATSSVNTILRKE
jgi:cephalosporin hydroxylase